MRGRSEENVIIMISSRCGENVIIIMRGRVWGKT